MVLLRYKQASAKVKGLQKEAGKLSSAAKEESKTAADALKDIANLEREIPSSSKVAPRHRASTHWIKNQFHTMLLSPRVQAGAENMKSTLDRLAQATDKNVAALDTLQDAVQRNTSFVQDLLVKGKAAKKVETSLALTGKSAY